MSRASTWSASQPTDPSAPPAAALEAFNPKRALLLSDQLLKRSPAHPSALASPKCTLYRFTLRTNAAKFDQALKALAHCLTVTQPVPGSVKNDIVKVVQTAKSANNGAALDDADVIMLLTWALRYIDHSELFRRPSGRTGWCSRNLFLWSTRSRRSARIDGAGRAE